MSKLIVICALFAIVAVSAAAAAGDGTVVLAKIDANPPLLKKPALPPLVIEKPEYYDVQGNSEKDLRSQMRQKGISWGNGKKYASVTTWSVKWNYGYNRSPQACSPDSFLVTVEIEFHYPRWIREENAPVQLTAEWERYMRKLMAHEQGHGDMAVEAARKLSRAVAAMAPAPTCAELDREIRGLCRGRMNRLNDDENRYDAETDHGRAQGAVFP